MFPSQTAVSHRAWLNTQVEVPGTAGLRTSVCNECITTIYLHIHSTPEPTSVLRQLAISYIYMNLWSIDRKSITQTFYNVTRCK